jgi:hypothetical protein
MDDSKIADSRMNIRGASPLSILGDARPPLARTDRRAHWLADSGVQASTRRVHSEIQEFFVLVVQL